MCLSDKCKILFFNRSLNYAPINYLLTLWLLNIHYQIIILLVSMNCINVSIAQDNALKMSIYNHLIIRILYYIYLDMINTLFSTRDNSETLYQANPYVTTVWKRFTYCMIVNGDLEIFQHLYKINYNPIITHTYYDTRTLVLTHEFYL